MSRFEVVQTDDPDQPFHVRLIGDNGEPLSSSENLTSLDAARTNVAAQAEALGLDGVEVRVVDVRAGSEPPC